MPPEDCSVAFRFVVRPEPLFFMAKLMVTTSPGSGAPLVPHSVTSTGGGAASIRGVPSTPQQKNNCRLISSLTQPIVPVSRFAVSLTLSFQTPFISLPFKAESGVSGLNVPAKGATPALIAVPAASSNTVDVPEQSFAPVP